MINIMFHPAESELDFHGKTSETTALEDLYSTTPLKIIGSMYQQLNEDELHSSFEEAISDRVLAFNIAFLLILVGLDLMGLLVLLTSP